MTVLCNFTCNNMEISMIMNKNFSPAFESLQRLVIIFLCNLQLPHAYINVY